MLKNGGAVFVWQGGLKGYQHIYARFLTPTNTFVTTNDILVNTFTNNFQINPAVAVLNNSNVVVVWGSFDEASANSLQDVYGQILSPTGQKVGGEFLINQFTPYNQRTPTVAALAEWRIRRRLGLRAGTLGGARPGNQFDVCHRQHGANSERGYLRAALRQQRRGPKQ